MLTSDPETFIQPQRLRKLTDGLPFNVPLTTKRQRRTARWEQARERIEKGSAWILTNGVGQSESPFTDVLD